MDIRIEGDHRAAYKNTVESREINVARDGTADSEKYVRWLLELRDAGIHNGRVAHIGGGFCVMARLMGPAYEHTIFEIEPEFKQFAPPGSAFIPGDYHDTFSGEFDIIIEDVDIPHLIIGVSNAQASRP